VRLCRGRGGCEGVGGCVGVSRGVESSEWRGGWRGGSVRSSELGGGSVEILGCTRCRGDAGNKNGN